MSGYVATLFLTAICARTSQGLNAHLSEGIRSTLYYHGGNCTWRVPTIVLGYHIEVTAPHLVLEGIGHDAEVLCVVNGTVLLQADITSEETTPPPHNVTLDTINKRLQWNHVFLLQLPTLFELVHGFTVTFQVYGKEDGVEVPSLSVPVSNNYFDLNSLPVNACAEYEFVVQAVSNISHVALSQNSSAVSGVFIGVPSFRSLSAVINTTHLQQQHLPLLVNFELEKNCSEVHPTFFIVTLVGFGKHKLNINSTHIDDGGGVFLIPLTDPVPNACDLDGTLIGGNDAGNCMETCTIRHSPDVECSSVMTPAATTSIAMGISSPVPPRVPSGGKELSFVVGIAAGFAAMIIIIVSLVIISLLILYKRKPVSVLPHGAEPNEYSSPMQRKSDGSSEYGSHTEDFQPTSFGYVPIAVSDHQMVPEVFPSTQYANAGPPMDTEHEGIPSKAKSPMLQGHVNYAEVSIIAANKPVPSYDNPTTGYVVVDHQRMQEMAQDEQHSTAASQRASSVPMQEKSLTSSQGLSLASLDGLLATLKTLGPKWYQLGTLLKLSETMLDETQTNIETDLQCLAEILKNWLRYHDPSLEKLNEALTEMNEPTLSYDLTTRGFFSVLNETPPELPPR